MTGDLTSKAIALVQKIASLTHKTKTDDSIKIWYAEWQTELCGMPSVLLRKLVGRTIVLGRQSFTTVLTAVRSVDLDSLVCLTTSSNQNWLSWRVLLLVLLVSFLGGR